MQIPEIEIIVTKDGAEIARKLLRPGEYVLGRDRACDLPVEDVGVSRNHAKLTINYDHALIEDLGSYNGTRVNGKRVKDATRLWPNQKIQIGGATIELRRMKSVGAAGSSLAPAQEAVKRILPEEFLRDKKYDIGSVIAQGGMGAILDAREATTERKVAMKVVLDTSSPEDLARFIAEAKVTAQLEHPNIVPVHELGVDENGQPFYTMKMVRGDTVRTLLERLAAGDAETKKQYPLPRLLTIFQKICDAVAFAHSRFVLHRDLKPENVMIGDYGEVLVMDWGLAKVLRLHDSAATLLASPAPAHSNVRLRDEMVVSATMAGKIVGTPQFMSPEQARGEIDSLDERTDIYSLGAILYQMLALRPPVDGGEPMEIVKRVGEGKIDRLTSTKKRPLPESLVAVVRKALAFEKERRYSDVGALQRDIESFQAGFATVAERAGALKQLTLFIKRHKAASVGVAAVLLIGGVLGTKVFIEGRRANAALDDLRKSAPAMRQLAESEAGFQRFDSALQKLDAALALDSENLSSYWQRAWILIGMEKWSDAVTALHVASEKDATNAKQAAIIPTLEEIAAAPETERWTSERALRLTQYLESVSANGSLAALSAKLRLNAESRRKLVEARVKEWLGPNAGNRVGVEGPGLIRVSLENSGIDTLEPLRGLPIDMIYAYRTNVSSLEPLRGMKLSYLSIGRTKVTSLEPLRGMKLSSLIIADTKVSDLSPVAGAPLREFDVSGSSVLDLSPVQGAPIEVIRAWNVQIVDFSPLSGAPIKKFQAGNTSPSNLDFVIKAPIEDIQVGGDCHFDLSPLRGKPLRILHFGTDRNVDLSPLRGAPITDLICTGNNIQDYSPLLDLKELVKLSADGDTGKLAVLRNHPTLRFISHDRRGYLPVADFWKEYDAQHPAKK